MSTMITKEFIKLCMNRESILTCRRGSQQCICVNFRDLTVPRQFDKYVVCLKQDIMDSRYEPDRMITYDEMYKNYNFSKKTNNSFIDK